MRAATPKEAGIRVRQAVFRRLLEPDDDGPPAPTTFPPYVGSRAYGFAHYNVVIPSLPEPHRFLACLAIVGQPGMRVFDDDHAMLDSPGTTATLANGTAATAPEHAASYSTTRDCELATDGSVLRFGDDLAFTGAFPDKHLSITRPGFTAELDVTVSDRVTWFARTRIYDHVGFPARFTGTLTSGGVTTAVDALGTFEYARGVGPSMLVDRPLPAALKAPYDFFTYHVLAVAPDTLLLLSDFGFAGRPLRSTAQVKSFAGPQRHYAAGVAFAVERYADAPLVAPDGTAMRMPEAVRWTVADDVAITGEIDTAWIHGVGTGWLAGCRFAGTFDGRPVEGRGYVEYADRRA